MRKLMRMENGDGELHLFRCRGTNPSGYVIRISPKGSEDSLTLVVDAETIRNMARHVEAEEQSLIARCSVFAGQAEADANLNVYEHGLELCEEPMEFLGDLINAIQEDHGMVNVSVEVIADERGM